VDPRKSEIRLGCHLLLTNDRRDIEKDRRITIPQFHCIDEHLLLPGVAKRSGVVEAITDNGVRPEAPTASETKQGQNDEGNV